MNRLYVVLLASLAPGPRIAQAAHGMASFARAHPESLKAWADGHNTIACVTVPDAAAYEGLLLRLDIDRVPYAIFREPDLGNAITAVAIAPHPRATAHCAHLPLA